MAAYPCSIGLHRYAGPQRSIYLTQLQGARPESAKLRLCPQHFDDVLSTAKRYLSDVSQGGQMSVLCELDGCTGTRATTVFAKVYEQGEDPTEYAGDLCGAHAPYVLATLHWGEAIGM